MKAKESLYIKVSTKEEAILETAILSSQHVILWPQKDKVWEKHRPQLNIYQAGDSSPVFWLLKHESVWSASNQSLYSKTNIMWQLSKPSCMSPHPHPADLRGRMYRSELFIPSLFKILSVSICTCCLLGAEMVW